jgi:hypothetical protein
MVLTRARYWGQGLGLKWGQGQGSDVIKLDDVPLLYLIPPSTYAALTIGCFLSVSATAFASIAETVTPLGFSAAYRASKLSVTISLYNRAYVMR